MQAMADQSDKSGNGRGSASVKGAAIWAAASQYCLFAVQFVTSVIISRFFLLPEEVGLFSVALAVAMVLSIIQDFGLTRYLGRHPTADEKTVRSCTAVAILFAAALVIIILSLAWPVASFYDDPRLAPILMLIGLSYIFVPGSIVPIALLNRRLDFKKTFAINFSGAAANSAVSLSLAALGFSAESLAWAAIAQTAARALAAQIARPTPISWPPRIHNARDIFGFGSISTVLYFVGGIGVRTPDMIVGRILGMTATGLFSRGSALVIQLHTLVAGAVGAIYYPTFARLRDEGQHLGPYYERVVAAHGAVVWPAMVLLAVLAEPIILLLYGENWVGAAPLLTWMALAECFFVAVPLQMDLPILLGRIRRLLAINIIDTVFAVATLIIGASIGLLEAAASRIVYGAAWFCLYVFWMQRLVGFSWNTVLRTYLMSALAAGLTAAPAIWAVTAWRTPATLGFTGLVAVGIGSGAAWLFAIFLLRHPAREDLTGIALHALNPLLVRFNVRAA